MSTNAACRCTMCGQANVMLEYPYEEAIAVLENSLGNAKERLVRGAGGRKKKEDDALYVYKGGEKVPHHAFGPLNSAAYPSLSTHTANNERGPDAFEEPDHHGGGEHGAAFQLERADAEEAGRREGGRSRGAKTPHVHGDGGVATEPQGDVRCVDCIGGLRTIERGTRRGWKKKKVESAKMNQAVGFTFPTR